VTAFLSFAPGTIVRKGNRRLVVVDCEGFDAVIGREVGTNKVVRVLIRYLQVDQSPNAAVFVPRDLATVGETEWREVVNQFEKLKPLLNKATRNSFSDVKAVADALNRHPATIYRWIEEYSKTQRISVLLRKKRADTGAKRLSLAQEEVIQEAITTRYLTAEKRDAETVIEEVGLLCSQRKLKKPHGNTIRNRISDGTYINRTVLAKTIWRYFLGVVMCVAMCACSWTFKRGF